MIYLKTPTSELSVREIRSIVESTLVWCNKYMGTKRKYKTLKFKVRTCKNVGSKCMGFYDFENNIICVNRNNIIDVKQVVRVVIHEYTHFLQNLRYYSNTLARVGYDNHPLEIEARRSESLYSQCWKDIKGLF